MITQHIEGFASTNLRCIHILESLSIHLFIGHILPNIDSQRVPRLTIGIFGTNTDDRSEGSKDISQKSL